MRTGYKRKEEALLPIKAWLLGAFQEPGQLHTTGNGSRKAECGESGANPELFRNCMGSPAIVRLSQRDGRGDELSQSAACFLFITSLARYKMTRSRPRSLGCRLTVPIFMEGYVFFLCRVFCLNNIRGGEAGGDGKTGRGLGDLYSRRCISRR